MIKIGYQGIEGSNAEQAAKDLVKKLNLADVEYVPLVDSPDDELRFVASHILAIKQCEDHIRYSYPQLKNIEVEDTGKAAKDLADGVLSDEYAVLCRKNAGEMFGLCLIDENIEDYKDNRTHFCLFELKDKRI